MPRFKMMASDAVNSKVLLAEDDPDLRRLITDALEAEGYWVKAVGNGLGLWAFLDLAAEDRGTMVDVVVSDIMMPGCTGIDVLNALRQRDWSTPVVLITAFGDSEPRAEAKRLGAAMLLDKPFAMAELCDVVRSIVPPVLEVGPEG